MSVSSLPQRQAPANLTERVAEEVRALMGRHHVTQMDLCGVLGVSQTGVSKRLRGLIPFDVNEVSQLAAYFDVSPGELLGAAIILARPDGYLFPSSHGGHLTPHHLGKLVSACLPDGLTMHTLRHRCATLAYAATGDLRAVQELLGHAKPETTARYTAVSDAAVRRAMEAAA